MSLIGERVLRRDGEAKVRGTAVYAFDYAEPYMLQAKILRSPVVAGRIERLDTARAETMAGVRAVVTAAHAPRRGGWIVKDQTVFAHGVVRFAGEPIAAVAADTIEQAAAAARAIELEIEPTVSVTDIESALAPGAPLVHGDWASYEPVGAGEREGNVAWRARVTFGDVDEAFARAELVVEDEFVCRRQHQSPIEPHCAVARFEAGRYVIHTSTQYPYNVRDRVAEFLDVRPSDIRVIVPTVGGAFGGKLDSSLEPYAALLARETGRPVKIVNTRREEFLSGTARENAIVRIRSAVSGDGEILGREALCLLDNGAYCGEEPAIAGIAPILLASTYRVGAVRAEARLVYTNTTPTGAFRGVNGPYLVFALEQHMDHIAKELGLDRREYRLRHVYREGDTMPNGQQLSGVAFHEAFERIEEVAPWKELSRPRPYHGVGVVPVVWLTNPGPAGVTLKLNEDGTVGLVTSGVEIGTGAVAAGVVQLVASELGVRPEDVVLLPPDTDAAGYDAGAQGSRTLPSVGEAARRAAAEVRDRVLDAASELLEIAPADLELREGHAVAVGAPERRVALSQVATHATWTAGPIQGTGRHISPPTPFDGNCIANALIPAFNAPSYHVHLAEVEVDPATGKVRVLRYVVAQDVGKAINPLAIEGQVEGGVVQGIGYALYEGIRIEDGVYLDTGFETYRLPTVYDAPPLELILLEQPWPHGPLGAKGAAEPPIVPVAAAIGCAVADAIGRPIAELPMTPFAVLAAIREAGVPA
jgi:CO/xanthine dehydrogenase Mo-binding subunit